MQEPVFPRGGHISSKGTKPSGSFGPENEQNKTSKKNKKKKNNIVKDDDDSPFLTPLNLQTLDKGWVVLGTVIDVMEYSLKLSLPGGITGKVEITNVSKIYCDLLQGQVKDDKDEDEDEKDIPLLPALFHVGQHWPCVVVEVIRDAVRPRFSLSLDPHLVNRGILPDNILPGMALVGAVKSLEEHGFVIDLGIPNIVGFLPLENLKSQPLITGQLVHCKVKEITGRSLRLSYLSSFPPSSPLKEIPHMDALRPGMTLEFVITMVEEDGLSGQLGSYTVCVHRHHFLHHPWEAPKSYAVGQKMLGTVLYVHELTKQVYMKLFDKSLKVMQQKLLQLYKGQDVEGAEVKLVTKNAVYLTLPDGVRAFAPKRNLIEKDSETDIKQMFPCKSKHNCRILSLDPLDNQVTVTLQKSVLAKKYLIYKNIKAGDVYQGVVERLTSTGLVVRLDSHLNGFIRLPFLSDTLLRNPGKIYPPGSQVNCKVLQVKPSIGLPLLVLTAKKSFLKSQLPIPSMLSDLQPGQRILGVVVQISTHGLLIATYNGIQGWVQPRHAATQGQPLEDVFHIGQTVTARVLKCDSENKKLYLTLNLSEKVTSEPPMGEIFENCRVISRSDTGLQVEAAPGIVATLPFMHLSDHPELCQPLLDSIVDVVPGKLRYFSCKKTKFDIETIFTRKSSLVQALPLTSFDSLSLGQLIPGVVCNITSHGVFVDLGNQIIGLARLKDVGALSAKGKDLLAVGYSVEALVKGLNDKDKTVQLSLKLTDVWNSSRVNASVDYLTSFLEDWLHLIKLQPGTIISVEVIKIYSTRVQVICLDHPKLEGFANLLPGLKVEPGLKIKAVVLVQDGSTLEVSLSPQLVKHISKFSHNPEKSHEVHIGQVIRCQALALHPKFVLASLAGHAVGKLVYIPSRKHIMDHIGRHNLFTLGAIYHVVIKRVEQDFIIGVLKQHDKEFLKKKKIENNVKRIEKRKLSEVKEPKELNEEKLCKKKKLNNHTNDSEPTSSLISPTLDRPTHESPLKMEEDEPSFSDEMFQIPVNDETLTSEDDKDTPSENDSTENDHFSLNVSNTDSKEQEIIKLLRSAPNKSLLWLQYMACALEKQGPDRVRQIARQALDTISPSEHDERLNIWLSLVNVELNHGTEEQLERTIQNALHNCEPSKVYSKLIKVFEAAGQLERANETLTSYLRKCRTQKTAWIQAAVFYMRHKDFDKARAIKERCLNNLTKKEYVEVMCKLGQLEFEHGDPEQGKTLFDTLVTSLPSRADLVSVYIDMLLKYNHIESAKSILHKLDVLKLPEKKKEALKKRLENI